MNEQTDRTEKESPEDLLQFYKNYLLDYWEVKYKYLQHQIETFEEQKKKLSEISGFATITNYEEKFFTLLKFELHFLKFQIIEALFSFIFALEEGDDINLWFNLSFPKDTSLRSFAVYDRISSLNNKIKMGNYLKEDINDEGKRVPLWKYLFYFKIDTSSYKKNFERISENIISLLYKMAAVFTDRDDYNAYKHSLRCYSSSGFVLSIKPHGSDKFLPAGYAKHGIKYLSKDEKNDNTIINITFKAFSLKEDSYYIEKAIKSLKIIIKTRISHFYNKKIKDVYFFEDVEENFHEEYSIVKFSRSTSSINSFLLQGYKAYDQGDFEDAIPYFKKVLQINDSHDDSIFRLGISYYSLKNYDEAIEYYKKYIKNSSAMHWKEALYNLALCYFLKKDFQKANKELLKYHKKYRNDPDEITNAARYLLADVKLNLNQQYFIQHGKNNSNYIKPAEKLLNKAEEISFDHPEIWFKLANIKDYLQNLEDSKQIYEKIIINYPKSLGSIINLARIYFLENNLEKVENLLQKALKINDKYAGTWIAIGNLKKKQGKIDDFREACEKSLEYSKNDYNLKISNNNLGDFYLSIEDPTTASKFFEKAISIDNSFEPAIHGLIQCLWELKKYRKIIDLTDDFNFTQNNAIPLKSKAYALSEIGQSEDSFQIIEQLMQVVKKDNKITTDLIDTKGDIFKKEGNLIKAKEFYQKALDYSEGDYEFLTKTKEKLEKVTKELQMLV